MVMMCTVMESKDTI